MYITIIQLFFVIFTNLFLLPQLIPGCNNKSEESSKKQSKSKNRSNKSNKETDINKNTTVLPPASLKKQKSLSKDIDKSKKEVLSAPEKKQTAPKTQWKCQKKSVPMKDKIESIKSLTSTQSTTSKHSTSTFSFSNPVKLNTEEKKDQRKQNKLEKNLKEWQSKSYQQILVTLSKSELRWEDGSGGLQNVNLENPSSDRIAVKIKCSDNILYRVNPVYTIIEPEERITIDILRDAGTQKTDKLVFVLSKVNNDIKDAQVYFSSSPKRQQMLVLPLIGASAVY